MKRHPHILISTLLTALGLWALWHLFHPDPILEEYGKLGQIILWSYRAGVVLFIALAIYVPQAIRRGQLRVGSLVLGCVSLVIAGMILFPIADKLYYKHALASRIDEYHPYLQLKPHEASLMDVRSGMKEQRIVFLGGSTTELTDGAFHQDWPSRVEKILRDSLGADAVRVFNQGRQWYTTLHTLINYETNIRQYRPEVIVVMQSINDLLQNAGFSHLSGGAFRKDYGHFLGPVTGIIQQRGLISYLWEVAGFAWHVEERQLVEQYVFPGIASYKRNLNTLIDLAQSSGTKVVLMSEPFLYRDSMSVDELRALKMIHFEAIGYDSAWTLGSALRGMKAYNKAMQDVARERNVDFIDLEKSVPKTLEYFNDDVHYTDKSFDIIARVVAGEMLRKGVISH